MVKNETKTAQGHSVATACKLTRTDRLTVDYAAQLEGISVSELLRRTVLAAARETVTRHLGGGDK